MNMRNCIFCTLGNQPFPEERRSWNLSKAVYALIPNKAIIQGHMLVIPRKHYARLEDIPAKYLLELWQEAIVMGQNLKKHLGAKAYVLKVNNELFKVEKNIGHVGHIHIHVIPRYRSDDALNEVGIRLTDDMFYKLKDTLKGA